MRIIDNKKDYYDCIQLYGQDPTNVYVRKSETVCPFVWPFPVFERGWSENIRVDGMIIGFCGSIYPLIDLSEANLIAGKSSKCFSIEDVDEFVTSVLSKNDLKIYFGERSHRWRRVLKRHHMLSFFQECEEEKTRHKQIFEDRRCPIFVAAWHGWNGRHSIEYNALLRPYDFARIFDPFRAFQEIAMFMGNMAIPQKPMPIIPDELKVQAHGFNKWSFRREPGDQR